MKITKTGLLAVALPVFFLFPQTVFALWDIHPGIYTSCEYSDNYLGIARREKSERIMETGGILDASWRESSFTWYFSGRAGLTDHKRYGRQDSTEVDLTTGITKEFVTDSLALDYSFVQTRSRDYLDEASGERRTHEGGVSYRHLLAPSSVMTVSCDVENEYAPFPDDDVFSRGGNVSVDHGFSPRTSLLVDTRYVEHEYDTAPDADETSAMLRISHAVTSRFSLGPQFEFRREERERGLDEEISTASLYMGYTVSERLSADATAGYTRLDPEHREDTSTTSLSGALTYETNRDTLSASVSRGFESEYLTNRYGTYRTKAASLSWMHALTSDLFSEISAELESRNPESNVADEETKDIIYGIEVGYMPFRHLEIRTEARHLQHEYEISDTTRENRYSITIEVMY